MLTPQHNQERRAPRAAGAKAILALLLLATLTWPAATLAQEPVVPQPDGSPAISTINVDDLGLPPVTISAAPADVEWVDGPAVYPEVTASAADQSALEAATTGTFRALMPYAARDSYNALMGDRVGFGSGTRQINSFPQVYALNAGWYVNWTVDPAPVRPAGIQYMQMVRVHQKLLDCNPGTSADRTQCPYVVPYQYTYYPPASTIVAAAKANPGSVWLIGNEPDRVDSIGLYQDESLPEVYATAYHDLSLIIKAADPTAKLAIGGVIQFTPLREEYLTKVWDSYKSRFGVNMPVDVWNTHNFIGPEVCLTDTAAAEPTRLCYGMAIPPGTTPKVKMVGAVKVEYGAYWGEDWKIVDKPTFEAQIRDMRAWMKARGQGNKPLIVTEYGVLWKSLCSNKTEAQCAAQHGTRYVDLTDPAEVQGFMLWSFDFFRTEKDCALTTYDECRLVQQWAWYSLDDANHGFNPYAALMNSETNQLSATGVVYSNYVRENYSLLQLPNGRLP